MKHRLVLRTPEIAERAAEIMRGLAGGNELHEVAIRPYHKDRSTAQNSLYWKWLTVLGSELGESKDALHDRYKERFLVHIYERDDAEYAAMLESVRAIYRNGMKQDAVKLGKQIVRLTSTTTATVPQMTEYLTEIDSHAASLGIVLPRHDDDYREAFNVR